jgi:hypothetical protein
MTMATRLVGATVLVMVLLVLLAGWTSLAAQETLVADDGAAAEPTAQIRRERGGDPAAPAISFIESPGAACYRPQPQTDTCFISWSYLSVSATSPAYIISMTITINDHLVAAHWGFFQSSIYIPPELYDGGFRVPCGSPGASGIPGFGRSHDYVVRARETGGLRSVNYGTVTCPAGLHQAYLPVTLRSFLPSR